MNIALINASPKGKDTKTASGALLKDLKSMLPAGNTLKEYRVNMPSIPEDKIEELLSCNIWIFAFPLYVDAVPSHLLRCLRQLEKLKAADKNIRVYAIVNCGFYEGSQNRNAISIMENWCVKSGLIWGMGIGFGGGAAAFNENIPLGKGLKTALGKAYTTFTDAIGSPSTKENICISVNFPRFLYRIAAEMGWRKQIRANGGKVKDLDKQVSF